MRVLHITARADFGGGPEHVFLQVMEQIKRDGIECFVACPDDYPYNARYSELVGNSKVTQLPHRAFSIVSIINILRFIRRHKIQILHSHGKGAGIYGRLLSFLSRTPSVHTFHGLHVGEYNWLQKKIYIAIEKILGVLTKKVVCVSSGERELILSHNLIAEKKLQLIDNGVFIPNYEFPANHTGRLKVLSVSRFDEQKNPELLLDISREINATNLRDKVQIIVIGEGEKFSSCRDIIDTEGLNGVICLHGTTTSPRQFMHEADVFLSTSKWEGMPIAVLEAMSEGLPVVATKVVGNIDVMSNHVEGVLFDLEDVKGAVNAISAMLDDDFRGKCGRSAHATATLKFSAEKMVTHTLKVYSQV